MLERLFTLQDRPISKDRLASFVFELSISGIPFGAIKLGIKKLEDQDLKAIKFHTIKDACSAFVANEVIPGCDKCRHTGFVTMISADGYHFSFACTCEKGARYALKQSCRQWNGARTQDSPRGKVTIHWAYDNNGFKQYVPDSPIKEVVNVDWKD